MSILSRPHFHDEEAAFAKLESLLWKDGQPICPHCGAVDRINRLGVQKTKPSKKHPEGKPVYGLWKCYHCRGQFTVRKGTVFEDSPIPLHKWFQAVHLMCSSKKGISSNQLARVLEITVKSTWFLSHRIREAMKSDDFGPLGGEGQVVEVDETYIGKPKWVYSKDRGWLKSNSLKDKQVVISLVERSGRVRSIHVEDMSAAKVAEIVNENVAKESRLHTDQAHFYKKPGKGFAKHESVNHGEKEYARGDVTTNTVEGYFGLFKRGMRGTYQHCSPKHLHRYLAEFDFRYNNRVALGVDDSERAIRALAGVVGKRLTYRYSA